MAGYADELKTKIPERLKVYSEYKLLLELIEAHNIQSKEQFESYIKTRNRQLQEWIDRNKERPSVASQSRAKAQEIDMHQRVRLAFWRFM